jgi:hypothetical protein
VIEPTDRRLAAIQPLDDGTLGLVWIAHNKDTDIVRVYDACLFKREVLAVIAESLNARGRWIPVVWPAGQEPLYEDLLLRGVNVLPNGIKDTAVTAEIGSREIWERMRTGRFKVDKRLKDWVDEYRAFYRRDGEVPTDAFPLMGATRLAVSNLFEARALANRRAGQKLKPRVSVL